MRLAAGQLAAHLQRPLLPVYLVTGDEPLQMGEALDALRAAAAAQGYGLREVLDIGTETDWRQLQAATGNLSLFGDRRLLEIRLPSSRIGTAGSQALVAYCQTPPDDTLLLIISPKLEKGQAESKWVQTLAAVGAWLTIWPLEPRQLPDWLGQRLRAQGLEPGPGVSDWLAARVEGNLLAAAQEVEKLRLLHGPGPLDLDRLEASVGDSARYSVFDLGDAALTGDLARGLRILEVLQAEGTALPLVLWALIREVRLLADLAAEVRAGRPLGQALAARREIWDKRRPLYAAALQRRPPGDWLGVLNRCAWADRAIKGLDGAEPWVLFQDILLGLAATATATDNSAKRSTGSPGKR